MNDSVQIRDEDFGDSLYDEPYPNEDIWGEESEDDFAAVFIINNQF